jgi:hypothetical protein
VTRQRLLGVAAERDQVAQLMNPKRTREQKRGDA